MSLKSWCIGIPTLLVILGPVQAGNAAPPAAGTQDPVEQALDEFVVDVTGDGVPDPVRVVLEGKNRLECVNGTDGQQLWSSRCHIRDWGRMNASGHVVGLFAYDVNRDGISDLIFQAKGCDAIVALDRKLGTTLWNVPVDELMGGSRWIDPAFFWGRDLLLSGDTLLVGVADSEKLRPNEVAMGGALLGLDPRDGSVRWRSPFPLERKPFSVDHLDGVRLADQKGTRLSLAPGGGVSGGSVSVPVGAVGVSVSASQPVALKGLADTPRMLLTAGHAIYAGWRNVVAVNPTDGSIEWSWTFPWPKELENGALLEHGGLLLVFGWQHHGSFPTTAVLAALDTSSGKLLWQYQLDLPMGTMMSQWSCEVTLRLADNITLEYVSPKEKKYPSRRLVLDRASGKIISEGAL